MVFKWLKKKKTDSKENEESPEISPEEDPSEEIVDTKEEAEEYSKQAPVVEEPEDDGPTEPESEEKITPDEIPVEKETPHPEKSKNGGFFQRLKSGLKKTRRILNTNIEDLFTGGRPVDDDLLEELEELLITSDMGVQPTMDLMDSISGKAHQITDAASLKEAIKSEIIKQLETTQEESAPLATGNPHVIMIVGVNGVGKTTTIGKLAAKSVKEGQKVLIAASDTFRAAAIEQLSIWADRAGAEIVKHKDGADPAAVAFDSIEAAVAREVDTVYVDTAGRLHTKVNLMEELKKIRRTISKKLPGAPHEILLVLDATTGQNALSQAKMFDEALGLTGLVLTKIDGTAKGGIVVGLCRSTKAPLQYIGVGEGIEDLQRFDHRQFVDALF